MIIKIKQIATLFFLYILTYMIGNYDVAIWTMQNYFITITMVILNIGWIYNMSKVMFNYYG